MKKLTTLSVILALSFAGAAVAAPTPPSHNKNSLAQQSKQPLPSTVDNPHRPGNIASGNAHQRPAGKAPSANKAPGRNGKWHANQQDGRGDKRPAAHKNKRPQAKPANGKQQVSKPDARPPLFSGNR